ncbi:unnamed protein product [Sympodiomycopsis kandeliae]
MIGITYLTLVLASLWTLASASQMHKQHLDTREHMYLAPGTSPSKRYVGKRAASKNGLQYPPAGTTPPSQVPQAWTDKYQAAKAAGLIPDLPVPKLDNTTGLPAYPSNLNAQDICNWEVSQCFLDDALRVAPDGTVVLTADDGPTDAVDVLIPALEKHNISMTHFLIGSQIIWDVAALQKLADMQPQQHFGSHSFTHTQLALFTDEQVVADLGWANQLIYDYTGYVPLYWRAPQGDVDKRVNAIAKHVFGLQHVFWTQDANDWCILDDGSTYKGGGCEGKTAQSLAAQYKTWADANPQTGMIVLSHELRRSEVLNLDAFFDNLADKKWKMGGIPVLGLPWYSNAANAGQKGSEGKDILPTSEPFAVSQNGRNVDLSKWSPGIGGQASSTGNTNSSNSSGKSGTSGTSTTSGSSQSGTSTSSEKSNSAATPMASTTVWTLIAAQALGFFAVSCIISA